MTTKDNKNEALEKLAALEGTAVGIGPNTKKQDLSRQWWLTDGSTVVIGGGLSRRSEGSDEITISLPRREPDAEKTFDLSNRSVSVTVCGAADWEKAVRFAIPRVSVVVDAFPAVSFDFPDGAEAFPQSADD